MPSFDEILSKSEFTHEELKTLLAAEGEEMSRLFDKALKTKLKYLDNYVHLRGLIEYSNRCAKYCLYCGVRGKNTKVERYTLSDEEVLECAHLAHRPEARSFALSRSHSDPKGCQRGNERAGCNTKELSFPAFRYFVISEYRNTVITNYEK